MKLQPANFIRFIQSAYDAVLCVGNINKNLSYVQWRCNGGDYCHDRRLAIKFGSFLFCWWTSNVLSDFLSAFQPNHKMFAFASAPVFFLHRNFHDTEMERHSRFFTVLSLFIFLDALPMAEQWIAKNVKNVILRRRMCCTLWMTSRFTSPSIMCQIW